MSLPNSTEKIRGMYTILTLREKSYSRADMFEILQGVLKYFPSLYVALAWPHFRACIWLFCYIMLFYV